MTSPDDEEWGPWVEHDGKGCPLRLGVDSEVSFVYAISGKYGPASAEVVRRWWITERIRAYPAWDHTNYDRIIEFEGSWGHCSKVVRYRIRRSRALRELIHMVENLPAPERGTV